MNNNGEDGDVVNCKDSGVAPDTSPSDTGGEPVPARRRRQTRSLISTNRSTSAVTTERAAAQTNATSSVTVLRERDLIEGQRLAISSGANGPGRRSSEATSLERSGAASASAAQQSAVSHSCSNPTIQQPIEEVSAPVTPEVNSRTEVQWRDNEILEHPDELSDDMEKPLDVPAFSLFKPP